MTIQAILFDADGVIQRPSGLRRGAWQMLIGPGRDVEEFVQAVFEVEKRALEGAADFMAPFSGLLRERHCPGTLQEALVAWTMIEPDIAMTDMIRSLRAFGIRCCLASNQEPYRASHMSEQLGYCGLFDSEFYSCRMGVAKPATRYFSAIVERLGVPPPDILFLDDHEANVDAARQTGINARQFFVDSGITGLKQVLGDFGVHVD